MENLSRLASKPGVKATLILSRSDGSIIRSTGLLAATSSLTSGIEIVGNGPSHQNHVEPADAIRSRVDHPGSVEGDQKGNSAEDIATRVLAFVAGANSFTEGMDRSDEVKLLRLRTRKNEIVIFPGMSFYLFSLVVMLKWIDRSKVSSRCHP